MGLFRKKKQDVVSPEPDVAEAVQDQTAGPPMSHESVLVLARLQGIADRLETAVVRLEHQANENYPDEADDDGDEVQP